MHPFHAAETPDFQASMQRGIELHADGELEQALRAFEHAHALVPGDVNAACACATLLVALSRPAAAHRLLLSLQAPLMMQADGAANLAIVSESCGQLAAAHAFYERALELEPGHLRSLNNLGLLAATESQWDAAIGYARRCVELAPDDVSYRQNLADFLAGARRYPEALEVIDTAGKRFSDHLDIVLRRITVLALDGQLEESRQVLATLDAAAISHLEEFISRRSAPPGLASTVYRSPTEPGDLFGLYMEHAFNDMAECDWRGNEKLTRKLRAVLSGSEETTGFRGISELRYYALMLDLHEEELNRLYSLPPPASALAAPSSLPAFVPTRKTALRQADPRIHVGLLVHNLNDSQQLHALKRQLALHDSKRFAFHIYSTTTQPDLQQEEALRPHTDGMVQTAHMSDAELAGRIRLDQLDLWMETGLAPGPSRAALAELRLAPVQLRQFTWHSHHDPLHDYLVSDTFVHPEQSDPAMSGAVIRLPVTSQLCVHSDEPGPARSRAEAGLPEDRLVLCALCPPAVLDPHSFAAWMEILRTLPDAALWLPLCGATAAGHLIREAEAAGVAGHRLLFPGAMPRSDLLAGLVHADLLLDTLRVNSAQGLEDALRMGVPAISCAGDSMASRLGGSMLRAAGLPQCVMQSQAAYVAEATRLGRNPQAMQQLRQHLLAEKASAPLFDLAARVREWEAAWATMAERTRAGLAPAAFDVPSCASPGKP